MNAAMNVQTGQEAWGWAWEWPDGRTSPEFKLKPVRGILAAESRAIGDAARPPQWFVPYAGKSKRPAWTRAHRLEAVNLCPDEASALRAYNEAVQKTIDRLQDLASMARSERVE